MVTSTLRLNLKISFLKNKIFKIYCLLAVYVNEY